MIDLRILKLFPLVLMLYGCSPKTIGPVSIVTLPDGNVLVIETLGRMQFVIPTDAVMSPVNGEFRPDFEKVLAPILAYAQKMPEQNIHIVSYGDNALNQRYSKRLHQFQSQSVASYLWQQGIDAKRLVMVGYAAGQYPVDNNRYPEGAFNNRRIEVSFNQ